MESKSNTMNTRDMGDMTKGYEQILRYVYENYKLGAKHMWMMFKDSVPDFKPTHYKYLIDHRDEMNNNEFFMISFFDNIVYDIKNYKYTYKRIFEEFMSIHDRVNKKESISNTDMLIRTHMISHIEMYGNICAFINSEIMKIKRSRSTKSAKKSLIEKLKIKLTNQLISDKNIITFTNKHIGEFTNIDFLNITDKAFIKYLVDTEGNTKRHIEENTYHIFFVKLYLSFIESHDLATYEEIDSQLAIVRWFYDVRRIQLKMFSNMKGLTKSKAKKIDYLKSYIDKYLY